MDRDPRHPVLAGPTDDSGGIVGFQEFLENIGIGISFVDHNLDYFWVNEAFAQLVGYSREKLLTMSIVDITHPDDIDLDEDMSTRAFSGEVPYFSVRKRFITSSGAIIVGDLLAAVDFDADGQPVMGVGILTDASTTDPTTKRIEALQRSAAIGQFTASAVHDLRNSLASISLIGETLDGAANPEAVQLLRRESEAALGLLGSIAAFASPQDDTHLPTQKSLSVGALLEQMPALLELVIPAGTTLIIDLESDTVFPDIAPREFQQVMVNLVLNARDATVGREGTIAITAVIPPDRPFCTDISVKDNGVGMTCDELASAFEPYFTTKGSDGTGLGLTICREIAERHGGALRATSVPGEGSTFTIRLPQVGSSVDQMMDDESAKRSLPRERSSSA